MTTTEPATQPSEQTNGRMDAAGVKAMAKELGAELVGIVDAARLNQFPPDPKWPQTPDSIVPWARSVVVVAMHVPAGTFRSSCEPAIRHTDNIVLRRIDRIAWKISKRLEGLGHAALVVASAETNWNLKGGTYGFLSMRHLAVEAGLGTLGLNVGLITPEYGARVYIAAVLTDLEVEPDQPMTEQICIGEGCSRCLYGCPGDAVRHFNLDKRACSPHAQIYGFASLTAYFGQAYGGGNKPGGWLRSREALGFWMTMVRVAGAFGACPRCFSVCPVGDDYHDFLVEAHDEIPESTPERVERGHDYRHARTAGDEIPGLNEWNVRWVGPDGYTGRSALESGKRRRAKAKQDAEAAETSKPN